MDYERTSISHLLGQAKHLPRRVGKGLQISLVLLLIFTFAAQPAYSQGEAPTGPMPTWTIQTVDGPRFFINMTDRSLAYKPDGTPCAAYGGDGLYYACYNFTTQTWDITTVDSSTDVGQYAALAFYTHPVTNKTEAFISYYDNYNGILKLVFTVNGFWQAPMTVPNPPPGTLPKEPGDMPEDPAETGDEATAQESPTFWEGLTSLFAPWKSKMQALDPMFPIENNKGVGKFTSIAVDAYGIYISYYDDREVIYDPVHYDDCYINICERSLKVAFWNGATWEIDQVDDYNDQGRVGLWSSIKVDFNGNLHVAYMSEKYDQLKYSFYNKSKDDWDRYTIDGNPPSLDVGSMCSIALYDIREPGIRGVPYISYLDFTHGNLRLARPYNSGSPDDPWTIVTLDTDGNTGWYTSIAVDHDQKVHISYFNADDGDLTYITGKIGGSWVTDTIRPGDTKEGLFSSIALNPVNGKPSFLHVNSTDGRLEFTYYVNKTTWNSLIIDYTRDVGYASSLAIANTGAPHISYLDASIGNIKHAFPGPYGGWVTYYPVLGPHQGIYNSIDLYQGLFPRIGSYETNNGNAAYGKTTGSGWYWEYVDDSDNDVGSHISMAIDSNDHPHFSYYEVENQNLVYATWSLATTDWYTKAVDMPGDVGKFSSITLSADDRAYISYFDASNNDLKMAYQTPFLGLWDVQTVDDGGVVEMDNVGWYTSIALDGAGNPHISYYDETNANLKYAYWNGAAWVIQTVPDPDSAGDVGRYTSLAIYTADNTRHVCYYDFTNGALKYARYQGAWEFQTVDEIGDVGYSCSIDVTTTGQPAISYYDNTRGDLKIALSYALPPVLGRLYLPIILR